MAERLKDSLINEDKAEIVCGPDSYRRIHELIDLNGGIDTELSKEETYEDIIPVELNSDGISAFISVMRGCENFCTYCVVPYTRGK